MKKNYELLINVSYFPMVSGSSTNLDEFHVCISDACTLQKINAKLM